MFNVSNQSYILAIWLRAIRVTAHCRTMKKSNSVRENLYVKRVETDCTKENASALGNILMNNESTM